MGAGVNRFSRFAAILPALTSIPVGADAAAQGQTENYSALPFITQVSRGSVWRSSWIYDPPQLTSPPNNAALVVLQYTSPYAGFTYLSHPMPADVGGSKQSQITIAPNNVPQWGMGRAIVGRPLQDNGPHRPFPIPLVYPGYSNPKIHFSAQIVRATCDTPDITKVGCGVFATAEFPRVLFSSERHLGVRVEGKPGKVPNDHSWKSLISLTGFVRPLNTAGLVWQTNLGGRQDPIQSIVGPQPLIISAIPFIGTLSRGSIILGEVTQDVIGSQTPQGTTKPLLSFPTSRFVTPGFVWVSKPARDYDIVPQPDIFLSPNMLPQAFRYPGRIAFIPNSSAIEITRRTMVVFASSLFQTGNTAGSVAGKITFEIARGKLGQSIYASVFQYPNVGIVKQTGSRLTGIRSWDFNWFGSPAIQTYTFTQTSGWTMKLVAGWTFGEVKQ